MSEATSDNTEKSTRATGDGRVLMIYSVTFT